MLVGGGEHTCPAHIRPGGRKDFKGERMKRFSSGVAVMVLVLAGSATHSFAQDHDAMSHNDGKKIMKIPAGGDMRVLVLQDLKDSEAKLTGLAEAMPAEKYGWRPAEGVRSVSEVFMHVANANFFFPTVWGVQSPASVKGQNLEKTVTEKAKVVQTLKDSFAHLESAVEGISDADMAKSVNFFGTTMSMNSMLLHVANHEHEHLGQAIAYARMNGVMPPWSVPRPGKEAPKE
jgi:uncharacterized damage-inducible protein DinB